MKVSEVMHRDIGCCQLGESMDRAAQVMWERDCGCVPIADRDNKIQGMITDRDIAMAAYTNGNALGALTVDRAMSVNTQCCHTEDSLEDALESMSKGQVHRLPVVDEEDHVLGILSLADVLQSMGREKAKSRRKLTDNVLEVLVEVTRPRGPLEVTEPIKTIGRRPLDPAESSPEGAVNP